MRNIKIYICILTNLFGTASSHQIVVYATLFDGINQIDYNFTIGNGGIVEVLQARCFAGGRQLAVDPLHDLLLDYGIAGVGQTR